MVLRGPSHQRHLLCKVGGGDGAAEASTEKAGTGGGTSTLRSSMASSMSTTEAANGGAGGSENQLLGEITSLLRSLCAPQPAIRARKLTMKHRESCWILVQLTSSEHLGRKMPGSRTSPCKYRQPLHSHCLVICRYDLSNWSSTISQLAAPLSRVSEPPRFSFFPSTSPPCWCGSSCRGPAPPVHVDGVVEQRHCSRHLP